MLKYEEDFVYGPALYIVLQGSRLCHWNTKLVRSKSGCLIQWYISDSHCSNQFLNDSFVMQKMHFASLPCSIIAMNQISGWANLCKNV